jgi:hypothetical protein
MKIEARDIVLKNFTRTADASRSAYVESYLSTPLFFRTLTELCDDIMKQPTPEAKDWFMRKRLCEVNKHLPAAVYLPFVSKSMRNHAILNIVVEEARIF